MLTTPATGTLAALLADVSTVFTSVLSWLNTVLEFVTGNPVMMIFVLLVIVRIVVRICRRWIPGL